MIRWIRRVAFALAGICAVAAVALLVLAVLAPTVEETCSWAISAYIFMACAALLGSQAGHLTGEGEW